MLDVREGKNQPWGRGVVLPDGVRAIPLSRISLGALYKTSLVSSIDVFQGCKSRRREHFLLQAEARMRKWYTVNVDVPNSPWRLCDKAIAPRSNAQLSWTVVSDIILALK